MARRRIVVVGGAFSGAAAAARAREFDEGADIVLIERAPEVSYGVAGLPYVLSGEVASPTELNRETARFFSRVYNVDVRTRVEVLSIDPEKHKLRLSDGTLGYDRLVAATGVRSSMPAIEGLAGSTNVFEFRRIADVRAIDRTLGKGAKRVAILGGGYFGLEAADGFIRRKRRVTVLERADRILNDYSPSISARVRASLTDEGVQVLERQVVERVSKSGRRVTKLHVSDGTELPVDLVVVCTGVEPRTELLRDAGAKLFLDGSVRVDARMATSLTDVFACGVCVSLKHAVTGDWTWLPQASIADRSGQVAGANAVGGFQKMEPVLGTALLRVGNLIVGRTGWTEPARGTGIARVHGFDRDVFLPGASEISMELHYELGSGKLLGAEAVGGAGTDKRLDVVATAIRGGLDIDALSGLDLGYAAPFGRARDVTNVAGRVAGWTRGHLARAWTPSEIREKDPIVVDVRATSDKRSRVDIKEHRRIPLEKLRDRVSDLKTLARSRDVVFVCNTGRKGYLAARIAKGSGIDNAGYLSGGTASWVA
jgi:NADPH-dependent 2,4-dienoyl-CoA reductase/sulfur reductase-like enzyme/rhodanese-related sulfurtransferase